MFLILVMVFACFSGGLALTDAEIQKFLERHNACRAGTGANLPPMTWDPKLANFAVEAFKDKNCKMEHTSNTERQQVPGFEGKSVGENLAWGEYFASSPSTLAMIAQGVDGWCAEKKDYNYDSNTCSATCGHYTQVVWDTSVKVGCSLLTCAASNPDANPQYLIACEYYEVGNMNGWKPYGRDGGTTQAPTGVTTTQAPSGSVTEAQTTSSTCTPSSTTEKKGTDTVTTTVTCENDFRTTIITTVSEDGSESMTGTMEYVG